MIQIQTLRTDYGGMSFEKNWTVEGSTCCVGGKILHHSKLSMTECSKKVNGSM